MKNGKFAKTLVLALSLALLIGSAVGIAASASTDSTGEIYAQSIVHDDKIQIAFAVDATADEVLAGTVALEYYFDGATANTKTAALYVDSNGDAVLKDGKVVLVTEGVSAQDLTSVVTATTKVNGEVKATKTYSVVQFLLTKLYRDGFATTSDAEDAKYADLYLSLIDYSAKAQAVFDPEETSINDYYIVALKNATCNGENVFIYNEPTTINFEDVTAATVENYTFKDKWNVTVDGTMAPYATDATIDVSTNTAIAPVMEIASGTGTYFNDESFDGVRLDFSEESDMDSLFGSGGKDVLATIQDGVLTGGVYNPAGSSSSEKYFSGYAIKYDDDKSYSSATYVFEADITYTSEMYNSSGNCFLGFLTPQDYENNTYSTLTLSNSNVFELGYADTFDTAAPFNYFTFFEKSALLNMGVRYNLRVEYSMATGTTDVYVNGELVGTANYGTVNPTDYNNPNNALGGFLVYSRRQCEITMDNIYVGVINGVVAE